MEKYELEKNIWTDADFEKMGWHDCRIYKIRLTENLELDIDYILQWNKPDIEGLPFTFWVAPATLVFKNINNIQFEIDTAFHKGVEIEDIELKKLDNKIQWTIITQQGDIEFTSDGFTQWIRQEPFFQFGQTISYIERYGFSLEQITDQENPNRIRQDIIEQQKKDFEHYENVKKRQLKRQEKSDLEEHRENGKIDLKDYLTKKKEIKEMLDYYDYWLKNTKFENW
ncbi:hypothetical protein [Cyclobacterium marinum]|uniref:Uncharacterized protein n=1 Tax=Cyclobacterium marinum (strain ATCC 25205 / DSM 745 / LMG 13164 / NCIMB 1802) TaxID=880070 RepID=G0J4V0_CYCMS|nr:hypothetical protein [Cyclobacterium marinum]AEL25330.1 hypothetical protein Cycma_1573 [Cyclobacterium marinum DSM 745]MBI0400565.1 hypothetical protein [Cyclobacterium marinum]